MADRIRTNPLGEAAYEAAGDEFGGDGNCSDDATGDADDCTPQEMAGHDIFLWKQLLGPTGLMGLPQGVAQITRDGATIPPTHTITIAWNERGDPYSYTLSVQNDPND